MGFVGNLLFFAAVKEF